MTNRTGSRWIIGWGLMGSMATVAAAGDAKFYAEGGLGFGSYPDHATVRLDTFTLRTTDASSDVFSWSARAGYRFGRRLAIEAGFVDGGTATATLNDASGSSPSKLNFHGRGTTVALVRNFSLGNWEPFFKVGLVYQDVHSSVSGVSQGTPFAGEASDHRVRPFFGIGTNYALNDTWRLQLGAERYRFGKDETTGQAKVFTFRFGVQYLF